MDLNQSRAVGGNILGPFQGSLTNVETSGRLQSQIQAILDHKILTELAGGVREGQNLPRNGLNLALEPSRGP